MFRSHLIAWLLVVLIPASAAAQCEIARFLASDGDAGDGFGAPVCLLGPLAVVSAPGDEGAGPIVTGSVYVLRETTGEWVEEQKLTPEPGGASPLFGFSLAVSEERIVVGAPGADGAGSFSGAVYVFRHDGSAWVQEAILTASDGEQASLFGRSVSIRGEEIFVGRPRDGDGGLWAGAIYLFRFDGSAWIEELKLVPNDATPTAEFGSSLARQGDRLLVGAPGDSDGASSPGSAYVLEFDGATWSVLTKLQPAFGVDGDRFGSALSLFGDRAAVGAPVAGFLEGATYVFQHSGAGWNLQAKLTPGEGNTAFGSAVAFGETSLLVGAPLGGDDGGAVHLFQISGDNWYEASRFTPGAPTHWNGFGGAIGLDGSRALIGAHGEDELGMNSGAAYLVEIDAPACLVGFTRGDCNGDGAGDIADAVRLLDHLFAGEVVPCGDACDPNDDGEIDLADPIHLLEALFGDGPPPAGSSCEEDPTLDALDCGVFDPCS